MGGASNVLGVRVQQKGEAFRLDKASATIHYYGFAKAGTLEGEALWMIFRATIDAAGDILKTEYPDGQAHYSRIWTGHAGYVYS